MLISRFVSASQQPQTLAAPLSHAVQFPQVQNEIFPWLVAVNSPHMDVLQCDFSVKNLKTKSRHDNLSNKKGAGAVECRLRS